MTTTRISQNQGQVLVFVENINFRKPQCVGIALPNPSKLYILERVRIVTKIVQDLTVAARVSVTEETCEELLVQTIVTQTSLEFPDSAGLIQATADSNPDKATLGANLLFFNVEVPSNAARDVKTLVLELIEI